MNYKTSQRHLRHPFGITHTILTWVSEHLIPVGIGLVIATLIALLVIDTRHQGTTIFLELDTIQGKDQLTVVTNEVSKVNDTTVITPRTTTHYYLITTHGKVNTTYSEYLKWNSGDQVCVHHYRKLFTHTDFLDPNACVK